MRYYRSRQGSLIAAEGGDRYDLTAARPELGSFRDLARVAAASGEDVDGVAGRWIADAPRLDDPDLVAPTRPPEVWAAGVTYEISEQAREEESTMPEMYLDVYDADRPEVFFKATPSRTVGPGEAIGIRGDSDWDVPEPELGLVIYRGDIVGYTVGNDVSSRDIEGQNPLYLPQAKVYDRCCALGPCVASTGSVADPLDLDMSLAIERDGETVFSDGTNTGEMVRTPEELAGYLDRHNPLPDLAVLLTGTSLVPPDSFTLREGDRVRIEIESIGVLENPVVEV